MLLYLFIFFPEKENEPKETARVPLIPARRTVGRRARKLPRLRRGQTGPHADSARRSDARRGTKGKNLYPKQIDTPLSRGGYLRPIALGEEPQK
jgi:hypothetical protein